MRKVLNNIILIIFKMKVLITTSGLGSRLGNLTNYTNKSLIRVGEKFTICYIVETYPKDTEFIVTLGYKGKLVKDFLELSYPEYNITYVTIDKYSGDGSSLGYSLYKAREYIQEPFFFHCCDAIITETINEPFNDNTMFGYANQKYGSEQFSSFNTNKSTNQLIKMNDKGEANYDYLYLGVSFIKDYGDFFSILNELLEENNYGTSLSDIHIMKEFLKNKISLKAHEVKEWHDTGTITNIQKASEDIGCKYNILLKEEEGICFLNNKVIKFFANEELTKKRFNRGKYHLGNLAVNVNAIRGNFFSMEKIKDAKDVSRITDYGEIKRVLNWAQKYFWKEKEKPHNFKKICMNFYKNKTESRIKKYFETYRDGDISRINGIHTGKIYDILKDIDFDYLSNGLCSTFHGDFILDNILKKDDNYILVDWRQDFGGLIECGDRYYDLAKMRHNIIFNHDNVEKGLFNVSVNDSDNITIGLKCNYFFIKQLEMYDDFIREHNYDLKKIKILNAMIWINMAPLHEYPLSKFLYYFGKLSLYLEIKSLGVI